MSPSLAGRMTYNPAGRYRERGAADRLAAVVTVRCAACGAVFEDVAGDMNPCPHCQKIARGAA